MTPNQKSFQQWTQEFCRVCVKHGGVLSADDNGGTWHKFEFRTKFGGMAATLSQFDYECETKRGSVWIYMKFAPEVDAAKVAPHVWGDFNHFSGKWNFYREKGKENLAVSRLEALAELTRRLNHVEAK